MTPSDLASIEHRFNGLSAQITRLSGQMEEMKRTMVTREEYNRAHAPLVEMVRDDHILVKKHEVWYGSFIKWRSKMGWVIAAVLFSIWAAPHWSGIAKLFLEAVK